MKEMFNMYHGVGIKWDSAEFGPIFLKSRSAVALDLALEEISGDGREKCDQAWRSVNDRDKVWLSIRT